MADKIGEDQRAESPVWSVEDSDHSKALARFVEMGGPGATVIFKDGEETQKPSVPEAPSDGRP